MSGKAQQVQPAASPSPSSQGASQAQLYATGLTEADMDKAQVGIASVWFEGNPCNMHLDAPRPTR